MLAVEVISDIIIGPKLDMVQTPVEVRQSQGLVPSKDLLYPEDCITVVLQLVTESRYISLQVPDVM